MVLADSHRISPVPCYSGVRYQINSYVYRTFTFYGIVFQAISTSTLSSYCKSYNLHSAETDWIWALPSSLAATLGITIVFYSSGYLDVSVLRVSFRQWRTIRLQRTRLPHSEIRELSSCLHLLAAYRSLPRPSSPLRTKAFTIRP